MMDLPGSTMRKYTTAFTFTDTLSRRITSCFGTSSTMTRRSTFTMRWMMGHTHTMPGPLRGPRRPRKNITPRSYSFSTLNELTMSMTSSTATTMTKLILLSSIERLDPQQQPFDAHDAHGLSSRDGRARDGVPSLAAEAHGALRREIRERFGGGADHAFAAGCNRAAQVAARYVTEREHQAGAHGRDAADHGARDVEPRCVGIEQDDRADDERHQATEPE